MHNESRATAGRRLPDAGAWVVSLLLSAAIVALFVGASTDFWHWFVLPVAAAGVLIGRDAIEWARGRVDVFDPVGLLGLYGVFYFLLSPLLHVWWDFWWSYRFNPLDWRPWLGYMALLNVVGLVLYRGARRVTLRPDRPPATEWRLNTRRFWNILPVALVVSLAVQIWIYVAYGGVTGFVYAYVDNIGGGTASNPFLARGWQFTLSESFPVLSAIGYTVLAVRRPVLRRWGSLALFLLFQLGLEIFFGGLRGSRNNVVFGLFWAVGLIHLHMKPFKRKQILVGAVSVFLFMNVYYFYKHGGLEGLQALGDESARDYIVSRKRQGSDEQKFILLHDFGRADIQALALYLTQTGNDYRLAHGRTYVGGAASIVPRSLWPNRPAAVHKERTELLHGSRSPYRHMDYVVPWIFGAPGEAILNFGWFGVPLAFAAWGLVVGWMARFFRRLPRGDTRRLLLPFAVGMTFIVFIGDSHLVFFFLLKDGLVPGLVLFLASDRLRAQTLATPARSNATS